MPTSCVCALTVVETLEMLATFDGATVESPQPMRYSAPATAGTALPACRMKTRRFMYASSVVEGWIVSCAQPARFIGLSSAAGKLSGRQTEHYGALARTRFPGRKGRTGGIGRIGRIGRMA